MFSLRCLICNKEKNVDTVKSMPSIEVVIRTESERLVVSPKLPLFSFFKVFVPAKFSCLHTAKNLEVFGL